MIAVGKNDVKTVFHTENIDRAIDILMALKSPLSYIGADDKVYKVSDCKEVIVSIIVEGNIEELEK